MLSTLDGEFVDGVVVDHLGYAVERLAELAENIATLRICHDLHVHETTDASEKTKYLRYYRYTVHSNTDHMLLVGR